MSAAATLIPPAPSPTQRFASFRHWYSRTEKTSQAAEARLLSRMKFFTFSGDNVKDASKGIAQTVPSIIPDGEGERHEMVARIGLVDLDGDDKRKINTLVIESVDGGVTNSNNDISIVTKNGNRISVEFAPMAQSHIEAPTEAKKPKHTLVMCHGYGAGLGFFYRNFPAFAQMTNWRIYAIDWLGMGRSSRPRFVIKSKTKGERVTEAENFFIDALEKWRELHGIERMTLLGHSLGGYFATVYSLKYPERVDRLILASPAGIPRSPFPKDLVQDDDSDSDNGSGNDNDNDNDNDNGSNVEVDGEKVKPRRLPSWVIRLWNANVTPMAVLRCIGPFGPGFVERYVSFRFSYLDALDRVDLHDYIYHISTAPGSGEYALSRILAPGAYARRPLLNRLSGIKVPVTFMYGDKDWMDYRAAEEAEKNMSVPTKIIIVKNAGHHLYLDNPDEFNSVVINDMKEQETLNEEHFA